MRSGASALLGPSPAAVAAAAARGSGRGARLPTRNCISGPTKGRGAERVLAVAAAAAAQLDGARPAAAAKSTITSARSPGRAARRLRFTGLGISPLSVAIWISGRAVREVDVVGAEVGDVEQPQAVAAGRDVVVGEIGAVDEDVAADDPVVGRALAVERVGELVAAVEGAVGDHQRDVAVAVGQRQRGVEVVVDDPHPRQAVPDVLRRAVEAVVVVPLERGPLGLAVLDQVVDVGALAAGPDQQVVAGGALGEPLRDPAVERGALRAASGRRAGRRTRSGCGRRAGGPSARRALRPSRCSKVTLVRCPARRRIVGPGKVPP